MDQGREVTTRLEMRHHRRTSMVVDAAGDVGADEVAEEEVVPFSWLSVIFHRP